MRFRDIKPGSWYVSREIDLLNNESFDMVIKCVGYCVGELSFLYEGSDRTIRRTEGRYIRPATPEEVKEWKAEIIKQYADKINAL